MTVNGTLPKRRGHRPRAGWAEVHPAVPLFGLPENRLMIYGPRDEAELEVVFQLLLDAYRFAGGTTPT